MGELRGYESAAGFVPSPNHGGTTRDARSVEISFCILLATTALIVGFASLPRRFVAAVGVVATVAALAAVILE